jgi:hypothetical protein
MIDKMPVLSRFWPEYRCLHGICSYKLSPIIMRFGVCGVLLQIVTDGKYSLLTIHLQLSAKNDCHLIVLKHLDSLL